MHVSFDEEQVRVKTGKGVRIGYIKNDPYYIVDSWHKPDSLEVQWLDHDNSSDSFSTTNRLTFNQMEKCKYLELDVAVLSLDEVLLQEVLAFIKNAPRLKRVAMFCCAKHTIPGASDMSHQTRYQQWLQSQQLVHIWTQIIDSCRDTSVRKYAISDICIFDGWNVKQLIRNNMAGRLMYSDNRNDNDQLFAPPITDIQNWSAYITDIDQFLKVMNGMTSLPKVLVCLWQSSMYSQFHFPMCTDTYIGAAFRVTEFFSAIETSKTIRHVRIEGEWGPREDVNDKKLPASLQVIELFYKRELSRKSFKGYISALIGMIESTPQSSLRYVHIVHRKIDSQPDQEFRLLNNQCVFKISALEIGFKYGKYFPECFDKSEMGTVEDIWSRQVSEYENNTAII